MRLVLFTPDGIPPGWEAVKAHSRWHRFYEVSCCVSVLDNSFNDGGIGWALNIGNISVPSEFIFTFRIGG